MTRISSPGPVKSDRAPGGAPVEHGAARPDGSDLAASAPGAGADLDADPAARARPAPPAPGQGRSTAAAERLPASHRRRRARLILPVIALLLLIAGGYAGYHWWTTGRFIESTDDAYLDADMTILAAKVSGYVTAVAVTDNQPVRAGDVIARIDDGDYRLAVQSARDKIADQQATVARIAVQADAAGAMVDQARAEVASAEAELERATLELNRQTKLVKNEFASRQTLDNARADRNKAIAALNAAKAGLTSATANIAVVDAQRREAEQSLKSLDTDVAQAERDLSFTVIRAPVDGVIGNKSVDVGQLVQPGTRLAAVVPLDDVYIDANFKETQLAHIRPGQTAEIDVDAYPNRSFTGTVASISPASGAKFSLLPPENATGNFTKIVQRLPVRIHLTAAEARAHVLRPGMSVVVRVDTRTGPTAAADDAASGNAVSSR